MPRKGAPKPGVDPSSNPMTPADDPVGMALRRLHDEVVAEPLPDEFLRLLGEIERKIDGQTGEE
ncbi:MAG: NepR family anti-sigma factor [Chakrabartia sp.]